jgi:hypothetical protein
MQYVRLCFMFVDYTTPSLSLLKNLRVNLCISRSRSMYTLLLISPRWIEQCQDFITRYESFGNTV